MKRLKIIRVYKNLKRGGGIQMRLLELLPRLAEYADVRVLCYRGRGDGASELESAGVPVDLIPLGIKWSPWNLRRYTSHFQRTAPDLVHTHEYTANTFAVWAAHRAGVPVLIRHIHTLVPWGWGGALRTRFRILSDRRAARKAQLTLAVSEAARKHYLSGVGLPSESCRVLYNGTDLRRFERSEEGGRAFRAEWGIPEETPVVGLVGRISRGKGHREFLEAARSIARTIPEARFLVVGEGGARPEMEAYAAELGLGRSVIFTGYRNDVPEALGAMNVFLFTSKPEGDDRIQEGFGVAAVEAQAAGVPVVALRLPMTEEVLQDGVTGMIVEPSAPGGLADACLTFLLDRERRESASAAAREWAKRFSLDQCVEETLRIYEELVARARPQG